MGNTDKLLNIFLVIAVTSGSVYLIKVLFQYSVKQTPKTLKQLLSQALENQRYQELQASLFLVSEEVGILEAERARLQAQLELTGDAGEQESLQQRILQKAQEIKQLKLDLEAKQAKLHDQAQAFSQNLLNDMTPVFNDVSNNITNTFFLEYTTVILVITSVVVLAILGILNGEQLSPIVASIAGYVLGRATGSERNIRTN